MKIVVNDIVAVPNSGGVYSVLEDFYNDVCKFNEDNKNVEWIFLLSGNYFKETSQIKIIDKMSIKKSWVKRLAFEFWNGKKIINNLEPDIYIYLQNTMTLGVKAPNKWAYLHQALPYQEEMSFSLFKKSERKLWIYQKLVGKIINFTLKHGNTNVVVQTKWMKKAVLNKNLIGSKDIYVLPPKIDLSHIDQRRSQVDETKMDSFFYPATGMEYKNHRLLFEAAEVLENMGYDFNIDCTLTNEELNKLELTPPRSVTCLGRISRSEVMDRYKSEALVFPSLIETFGLPILEAAVSNDFIIIGNTSFGREILANYTNKVFFNVKSVNDLVDKMKKCLDGEFNVKRVHLNVQNTKSLIDLIFDNQNS